MKKIGIIEKGIMGTDLAHITAEAGYQVKIFDNNFKKLRVQFSYSFKTQ